MRTRLVGDAMPEFLRYDVARAGNERVADHRFVPGRGEVSLLASPSVGERPTDDRQRQRRRWTGEPDDGGRV